MLASFQQNKHLCRIHCHGTPTFRLAIGTCHAMEPNHETEENGGKTVLQSISRATPVEFHEART